MPKRKKPQSKAKSSGLRQWMDDVRAQLPGDARIVERSAGESKISAVFAEFIDPFTEYATTQAGYIKLIGLGVSAWNAALLPENERQKMMNGVVQDVFRNMTDAQRTDINALLDSLVQRKTQFFADDHRYILSYHLEDTGTGYQLMMVSTVMDEAIEKGVGEKERGESNVAA